MSVKTDLALEKLQGKSGEKIPIELYYRQDRRAFKRECIHWAFHFFLIGVIAVMIWQFLQFDTYYYEQGEAVQNVIGVDIGGDLDVTTDKDKETEKPQDSAGN